MSFDPNIERKQTKTCECGKPTTHEDGVCDFCREPLENELYSD
jgi:hypothetical protein